MFGWRDSSGRSILISTSRSSITSIPRQTVRTQQKAVTLTNRHRLVPGRNFDLRMTPDRTQDDILVRVMPRFFQADQPAFDHLHHLGVVFGHHVDSAVAD